MGGGFLHRLAQERLWSWLPGCGSHFACLRCGHGSSSLAHHVPILASISPALSDHAPNYHQNLHKQAIPASFPIAGIGQGIVGLSKDNHAGAARAGGLSSIQNTARACTVGERAFPNIRRPNLEPYREGLYSPTTMTCQIES